MGQPCLCNKPLMSLLCSWSNKPSYTILPCGCLTSQFLGNWIKSSKKVKRWRACREIWGCGIPRGHGMKLKITRSRYNETRDGGRINIVVGGEFDSQKYDNDQSRVSPQWAVSDDHLLTACHTSVTIPLLSVLSAVALKRTLNHSSSRFLLWKWLLMQICSWQGGRVNAWQGGSSI